MFRNTSHTGLLLVGLFLTSATWAADDRPNIVFILADDLGCSDLACYGRDDINTPNLDNRHWGSKAENWRPSFTNCSCTKKEAPIELH